MNVFKPTPIIRVKRVRLVSSSTKRSMYSHLHRPARPPKKKRYTADTSALELMKAKKQLAARMLMMGFEPVAVAEMYSMSIWQLRRWINDDQDFRMALQGMEQEFFQAVEKRHQFLLFRAYERLHDLLDSDKAGDIKWGIDRAFKIHGKYIERTEDLTPAARRWTPEQTSAMLEKGIKYLELTRQGALPAPETIELKEGENMTCQEKE